MSQAPEFVSTEPCPVHLIETSQAAPAAKPLDDSRLQQLFGDAIEGALALGFQNSAPPPRGHWLQRFWDIGRAEASRAQRGAGEPLLAWSDEKPPQEEGCRYNHVTAETPFGRFLISWKGWKTYPGYTIDEGPVACNFYTGDSLEESKAEAQRLYSDALRAATRAACDEPPAGWLCTRVKGHEGPCAAIPDAGAKDAA
jgi:hypothetical protein